MKLKLVLFLLAIAITANAYQIHMVYDAPETSKTVINNPEGLQYFFGELNGNPEYYLITSDKPFLLSVRLLVPDVPGDAKQIMSLYVSTEGRQQIFLIEPTPFEREQYYDKFSSSWYIKDAEAVKQLEAGSYVIRVFNDNNMGKYMLSLGDGDPSIVEKITTLPVLLAVKEGYLGRDIVLPALHKFGIVIILAALAALYASALASRKKESNRNIIDSFFLIRYAIWAGIVLFFLTGFLMYQRHESNLVVISELLLGVVLTLYWAWISIMGIGKKFSIYRDKKVLIKEKYNRIFSTRLLIQILLWTLALLMASVF